MGKKVYLKIARQRWPRREASTSTTGILIFSINRILNLSRLAKQVGYPFHKAKVLC